MSYSLFSFSVSVAREVYVLNKTAGPTAPEWGRHRSVQLTRPGHKEEQSPAKHRPPGSIPPRRKWGGDCLGTPPLLPLHLLCALRFSPLAEKTLPRHTARALCTQRCPPLPQPPGCKLQDDQVSCPLRMPAGQKRASRGGSAWVWGRAVREAEEAAADLREPKPGTDLSLFVSQS